MEAARFVFASPTALARHIEFLSTVEISWVSLTVMSIEVDPCSVLNCPEGPGKVGTDPDPCPEN